MCIASNVQELNGEIMDFRNGLGESFRKGEADGKRRLPYGSRAYQRFFEDYEEIQVPKENGKGTRIKRIYRGMYYRQVGSDGNWYLKKVLYPLLLAGSFVFFVRAALPNNSINHTWYAALIQAVSMLAYFCALAVMGHYIAAPRDMTVAGWKRACRPLKRVLRILLVSILAALLITMGYHLCHRLETEGAEWYAIWNYLFSALAAGSLYVLEKRTVYTECKAQDQEGD